MEKEYYRTTDIDLASTLLASGIPIDGIYADEYEKTRDGLPKAFFYFVVTNLLTKTIDSYWGRKLRVEPLELLGARKEILTRLKEGELYAKNP